MIFKVKNRFSFTFFQPWPRDMLYYLSDLVKCAVLVEKNLYHSPFWCHGLK